MSLGTGRHPARHMSTASMHGAPALLQGACSRAALAQARSRTQRAWWAQRRWTLPRGPSLTRSCASTWTTDLAAAVAWAGRVVSSCCSTVTQVNSHFFKCSSPSPLSWQHWFSPLLLLVEVERTSACSHCAGILFYMHVSDDCIAWERKRGGRKCGRHGCVGRQRIVGTQNGRAGIIGPLSAGQRGGACSGGSTHSARAALIRQYRRESEGGGEGNECERQMQARGSGSGASSRQSGSRESEASRTSSQGVGR